jgi:hypothetical protein
MFGDGLAPHQMIFDLDRIKLKESDVGFIQRVKKQMSHGTLDALTRSKLHKIYSLHRAAIEQLHIARERARVSIAHQVFGTPSVVPKKQDDEDLGF